MSGIGSELKELEGLSGGWRKYETAWAILIPNVPAVLKHYRGLLAVTRTPYGIVKC